MILQLILAAGAILLYLCCYYMLGSLVTRWIRVPVFSLPLTLLLGFFTYFLLFTVIALPMKIALLPLSTLSLTWAVLLLLIAVLFFVTERGAWGGKFARCKEAFAGRQKYLMLMFGLLVLIQLVLINLNDESYALWDQAYYIGDAATSLYTNTISQYDPYTGRILSYLNTEYLLETYQNHTAVMCQILGLHPLVESLTVMASVVVILYNLTIYELALVFFHGSRSKSVCMTAFLTLLNYFSFNLYTAAEFLFIRPFEGKTILAVIILPLLLYFFLKNISEYSKKTWWICSFLVIAGSFGLNMSSLFMVPFEISVLYVPLAIRERRLSVFLRYLILLAPCIVMAILYLLTKHWLLIYTS